MAKQKRHDGPCGNWHEFPVNHRNITLQTQSRQCGRGGCNQEQYHERTRKNADSPWGGWSGWRNI